MFTGEIRFEIEKKKAHLLCAFFAYQLRTNILGAGHGL